MDEVTVAIISLSVSTAVSVGLNLIGYSQNFQKHYSTVISKERMAWVKETRKLAAEFLAFCETNTYLDEKKEQEFNKLKNELLLNLNSDGKKYKNDAIIRNSLMKSSFSKIKKDLPEIRAAFINIFKDEWDKSKLEAGRSLCQAVILNIKSKHLSKYYEKK